jgi:WD40 repeat protein
MLRRLPSICHWCLVLLAGGVASAAGQPGPAPATDRYGDPLPADSRSRLGTLRWRHSGRVTFVGFVPKKNQLVTACTDGFFRVWNVASGKEIRRFGRGHDSRPTGGLHRFWVDEDTENMALSPDGGILAVAGPTGRVTLWQVDSGKELRVIPEPKKKGRRRYFTTPGVAFSADGKTLAIRGGDDVVRLWHVAGAREVRRFGQPRDPNAGFFPGRRGDFVAFAPNGKLLALARAEQKPGGELAAAIIIYDLDSGNEKQRLSDSRLFNLGLAFSPDSKLLAVGGTLFDVASGKQVRAFGDGFVPQNFGGPLFAPDGSVLALHDWQGHLQLWDVKSGRFLRSIGDATTDDLFRGNRPATTFSPDGRVLAESRTGHVLRLWQVADGKEITQTTGHADGVVSVGMSADKKAATYSWDKTLLRWDTSNGKELRRLRLSWFGVDAGNIALSADGKLAAGTVITLAIIWDLDAGRVSRTFRLPAHGILSGPEATGLALAPDGKQLAVRMPDRTIHVIEIASGKVVRSWTDQQIKKSANNAEVFPSDANGGPIVFSPDGDSLAIADSGAFDGTGADASPRSEVRLWNFARSKRARPVDAGKNGVQALAYSPDGRTLLIVNGDASITLCEVLTGQEYLRIKGAASVRTGGKTGEVMTWFGAPTALPPLAVAPDGRTLAVTGPYQAVHLWDLRTGKDLGQLKGHEGAVLALAFAADGRTLISGAEDTTALVWDAEPFLQKQHPAAVDLDARQVEKLWTDLAAEPATAFKAIYALSDAPKQALPFLRQRLQPAKPAPPEQVDKWVADLDSSSFQVRRRASTELVRLGDPAEPALRKALQQNPSLEMRRRLDQLLEQIASGQTSPTVRQALRAIHVLELLGGPEARQILERLAHGPAHSLSRQAQAALERLQR